jgi:hypothetical protein
LGYGLVVCTTVLVAACAPTPEPAATSTSVPPELTDRAAATGLSFVHANGMSGRYFDVEVMGSGAGLIDYDNDGDLDVYLVQGQPLGPDAPRAGVTAVAGDRLFRNDLRVLPDGTREVRFTDVTRESRIDVQTYGMGVATGDFDNDGWTDLYLTRLGANVLLRNNGDGTFTDASRRSGTAGRAPWSVAASFLDIDRDGWLDLYVGNYLDYALESDVDCRSRAGGRDYCDPGVYRPVADRLYRNRGDGTFEDVTGSALRESVIGPALGVVSADFNSDGWIDIYVANDRQENHLWTNQHDGTFRNTALEAGVARNGDGRVEASMGVDAGDFDNDGDDDLMIANLASEGMTLYANDGRGLFEDVGGRSGLRGASLAYTGFGAAWFDADNDGWLDVLTVNGAVQIIEGLARLGDPFPFHQRKQLLRNTRDGRFEDVTDRGGAALRTSRVGRGAAFGDIDNDGDQDVVVSNNNGPAELLLNEPRARAHWIGLRLAGSNGRDMLGARVAIVRDGRSVWRRARVDGSYASANDPRVLVGLGDDARAPSVRVVWPDGREETWTEVPADRWTTLTQGSAR